MAALLSWSVHLVGARELLSGFVSPKDLLKYLARVTFKNQLVVIKHASSPFTITLKAYN